MKQIHTTYQNSPNSFGLSDGNTAPERDQFYFIKDHLGSSGYLTDINGKAIQHIEYLPFGELLLDQKRADWGTVYKYNGKELDCESGYYYYGARYYNPGLGRFLSVDPLAHKMPSWSPFSYTFNNPLRFTDPTGMEPEQGDDWFEKNGQIEWFDSKKDNITVNGEEWTNIGEGGFSTISSSGLTTNYERDGTYNHHSNDGNYLPEVVVTGEAEGNSVLTDVGIVLYELSGEASFDRNMAEARAEGASISQAGVYALWRYKISSFGDLGGSGLGGGMKSGGIEFGAARKRSLIKRPKTVKVSGVNRIIHTGPRGGKFYINKNGNKTYLNRDGSKRN